MAEYAFFFPTQPGSENAVKESKTSHFTDNDQLQQHSSFLALQASSSDQQALAYNHTVLFSSHDQIGLSSLAACSSNCYEAFHHHMQQHPHDHPHHQHDCKNHRKTVHFLDERHTCDKLKAEIVAHPLFENLLQAHVQCLTVGVSSHHMHAIEAQLGRRHGILTKYLMQGTSGNENPPHCREEIDAFMENYLQMLLAWKKHLEALVIPPTIKTLSTLCEIEHAFYDLTGVHSNAISNARVSVNDEWENMCLDDELDASSYGIETQSRTDRCIFEHVKMELKNKLKDKYREYIQAMRKEIVKKRQVGKLPGDTIALKKWWNAHSRWPYPTEQEKKKLVQETGLEMQQINNWFINHRKRNWVDRQSPLPPLPGSFNAASAGSSSLQYLPPPLYS